VRSWPPIVAVGTVLFWTIVAGWYFGGHDALTYLAAGERLNGGHPLYAIGLGDRIVETAPPFYGPLLSPPLIAVLFRPLALFGLSAMWAWTVALGIVMGATAWHLARTPMAAAFVVLLGAGVGMAAISGNVSTLFIPAYVAIWRWRDRPIVGALVGVMAVTKLLPLVFVGFLMAGRRWRALGWCAAGAGVALLLTVAGAGWDNTVAYLAVAPVADGPAVALAGPTGRRNDRRLDAWRARGLPALRDHDRLRCARPNVARAGRPACPARAIPPGGRHRSCASNSSRRGKLQFHGPTPYLASAVGNRCKVLLAHTVAAPGHGP
jgi:hypothetical protein